MRITKQDLGQLFIITLFVIANLGITNFISDEKIEAAKRFDIDTIEKSENQIFDFGSYQGNLFFTQGGGLEGEKTSVKKFSSSNDLSWEIEFQDEEVANQAIIAIGKDYLAVKPFSSFREELNPTKIDNETNIITFEREMLILNSQNGEIFKDIKIPFQFYLNHSLTVQLFRISFANGIIEDEHLVVPSLIRISGPNNTRLATELKLIDYNLQTDVVSIHNLLPDGDEKQFTRRHRSQPFYFEKLSSDLLQVSFIIGIVNDSFTSVEDEALYTYYLNFSQNSISFVPEEFEEFSPCGSSCHYGLTDQGRLSKILIYSNSKGFAANVSLFDIQAEWNFPLIRDFPTLENIISFDDLLVLQLRGSNGIHTLSSNDEIFFADLGQKGVSSFAEIMYLFKTATNKLGVLNHYRSVYSFQVVEFLDPQEFNEVYRWMLHGIISTIFIIPILIWKKHGF